MKAIPAPPTTIDEYPVRSILEKIRARIRKAAPAAQETISYRMPSFVLNGHLVYFGAFKNHIGFYPPVRDDRLRRETKPYEGEKGNLRLPLDQPIPYALIGKIVKARVIANQKREDAQRKRKKRS